MSAIERQRSSTSSSWSWAMRKSLRELAHVEYGASPSLVRDEDGRYPIYGTGGVQGFALRSLFDGPITVVGRKGTLGNPLFSAKPCWVIDTAYGVVAKAEVDAKWLFFNLARFDLASLNEATGVPSINRNYLYRVEFWSPHYRVQRRIADILTTVDNQIEKTEALIAKYQSIKQGLMHDLFTRGVDEHGRLRPTHDEAPQLYKESEVGFIPASWSVAALESLVAAGSSITYGVVQPGAEDDQGVRFLRGGDVYDGEIAISELRTISKAISATYRRTLLRGGELVMSLVGYPGEVAVVPVELRDANIARQVALIRLDEEVVTPFVMEYLLSSIGKTRLFEKQNGSAQQVINLADLKFVQVTLPLRDEQTAIANHLRAARDRVSSEKSHLAKLRRIKLGLMQDLLTGKVPVKPEHNDPGNGVTSNGSPKAGVKARTEGVHA
ncbi:MAG: restriction endonuclease subunit S [Phycisphaeraceae bacterium]|nr:MAG: restriction endonuclease subunit S [Phycisphaeraceae bacterium]